MPARHRSELTDSAGNSLGISTVSGSRVLKVDVVSSSSSTSSPSAGRSPVTHVRNVYSSINVTTAAYVQLIASTSATINLISVFDSSGQTLIIAFGAAASEVDKVYIFPGGNGDIPLLIPSGTRVSIKAVSGTANTGEISINAFS